MSQLLASAIEFVSDITGVKEQCLTALVASTVVLVYYDTCPFPLSYAEYAPEKYMFTIMISA